MKVAVASRSFSRHPVLREELIRTHPDVRFNDAGLSLKEEALIGFVGDAEALIVGLERIDAALLDTLPGIRVVSKYGVGVDALDLDAMQQRGVRLGWTGGVNRQAVAELALFFMVGLLRRHETCRHEVRERSWRQVRGRELASATVGVVGCGHVGKQVSRLSRAYGARVLAHDVLAFEAFYRQHDVDPVSLECLLERSDVVSLHLPLDASTRGILDEKRLDLMRPGALLVNTARGGLVDETELARRLTDGRIGGVAFDVLAEEPPAPDHPLLAAPNAMLTPHVGGSTEEAVLAMGRAAIAGLSDARPPRQIPDLWPIAAERAP